MALSSKARDLHEQVAPVKTAAGTIKKLAKAVKKDHDLGSELWSTGHLHSRLLAVLILDKGRIDQALVDTLCADMLTHPESASRTRIMEWLMANQLTKSAQGKRMIASWEHSPVALQRRTFWYYQSRLRWTGKTGHNNTEHLLDALDARMAEEEPIVQAMMNFTAGWIGVYQPEHRARCEALGTRTGLYKDQVVPKGCTPSYLPEFIRVQADKKA
ncbi:MAG: DNA alkylation repair protein [Myxococcota bacterium]